jgi:transposase
VKAGFRRRPEADWAALACELKRPGVNLMVLWEEYRERHPDGLRVQPLLRSLPGVRARLSPVMRQDITSPATRCSSIIPARRSASSTRTNRRVREAEIFVAVLGASS